MPWSNFPSSTRRHPDMLGRLLSLARFVFMAGFRGWFRDRMLAELLPPLSVGPGGTTRSPLWDVLGHKFTGLSYDEADRLSRFNKEFIWRLFPAMPVHASLLPESVQQIIGQVGPGSVGAKRLLEGIGFQYSGRVDPFEGGPHFEAETDQVSIVRDTRSYPAAGGAPDALAPPAIVALVSENSPHFRAVWTPVQSLTDDEPTDAPSVLVPADAFTRLGLGPEDHVLGAFCNPTSARSSTQRRKRKWQSTGCSLRAQRRTRPMSKLKRIVDAMGGILSEGGRRALIRGPGHGPADRSVSHLETEDGRVLIHCFSTRDDWRAVRAELADLGLLAESDHEHAAVSEPIVRVQVDQRDEDRRARVLRLWEESIAAAGTVGERYLRARAIEGELPGPEVLRFHPRMTSLEDRERRPALVACLVNNNGVLEGIQVTLLTAHGAAKACAGDAAAHYWQADESLCSHRCARRRTHRC